MFSPEKNDNNHGPITYAIKPVCNFKTLILCPMHTCQWLLYKIKKRKL